MSLKEFTKDIFTHYGLTELDIKIYLGYIRVPLATMSEVQLSFEEEEGIDVAKVTEITEMLVEKGFLKKVEGIIDRFIPLEPYFELFTAESKIFRDQINQIKDQVLSDQSNRFDSLESIQGKSIQEVETAVSEQVKAFFDDSDAKSTDKKNRIEKATSRFTETSKQLEIDLHAIIEEDYSRSSDDINRIDKESDDVWDSNTGKFTKDNETLNIELNTLVDEENKKITDLTANQVTASKGQETMIHSISDVLNSDLKSISQSFISDNEGGINTAKDNITNLIAELLKDFGERVDNLEKQLKQDLDGHVDRHKNIASELKPKMEQILEKYLERMNKVVTDLKAQISKIMKEHTGHVANSMDTMKVNVHSTVDARHDVLKGQVDNYKGKALQVLSKLLEEANRFSDFSEDITKIGLFFGKGKKSKFVGRWTRIEEDIANISRTYNDDFLNDWGAFVSDTNTTSTELKNQVDEIVAKENEILSGETKDLDQKAQETINAQLETLATDMATEIDSTLTEGIKDCSDTSIKLKDSLENSLKQHSNQYTEAINRHKEDSLRHYTDFDGEIKRKNESWVKDVDNKIDGGKRDISTEIETQIRTINEYKDNQIQKINDHLDKTQKKNVEHSTTFENDVNDVKSKQRAIYDELLKKIRIDFDKSKVNSSGKIDAEINLWNGESADMDKMLTEMLEDHKAKYKENAEGLQTSLSTSMKDNVQNVKDAIADFTLEFMNAIDDATEKAEGNEEKLTDIQTASSAIPEISKTSTWHTVGRDALVASIKDAIKRVKSSIIIVTPIVIPEILQLCSTTAYQKKAARFMLTSNWDLNTYGSIIQKMKSLGNIQFRNLTSQGEYYACTRDAEEVILCPAAAKEGDMVSMVSNHELWAKLYSSVIGPMFLSNSRPVK